VCGSSQRIASVIGCVAHDAHCRCVIGRVAHDSAPPLCVIGRVAPCCGPLLPKMHVRCMCEQQQALLSDALMKQGCWMDMIISMVFAALVPSACLQSIPVCHLVQLPVCMTRSLGKHPCLLIACVACRQVQENLPKAQD